MEKTEVLEVFCDCCSKKIVRGQKYVIIDMESGKLYCHKKCYEAHKTWDILSYS